MMKANFSLLFLLLAISICFPHGSFAKEQLAVMDLKAKHGVEESLAEGLSVVIRDKIQSFGDYEVLSKDDVEVIAERTAIRQSLGCDETQCLINIGRSLGTKYMVAGAISKFGDTYSISLRLIDTMGDDPGVKKRENKTCKCAEDELINSAMIVSSKLFGKKESQPIGSIGTPGTSESDEKYFANSIGMKFVSIPAGSFMMGSNSGSDEKPVHKVTITMPFYLQTTEVTQGQWRKVMGNNLSYHKNCGDDCPVENISWNDAQKFIRKLNQLEGTDKYRLPSEAEWEYACRAGSTTRFSFGDDESSLREYAWYGNNSKELISTTFNYYSVITHPVGQKRPNAWGLYDMHGNVWEWCQDWYDENYNYYARGPERDPKGRSDGRFRILRGGSYDNFFGDLRSANRSWYHPDKSLANHGFRVARAF